MSLITRIFFRNNNARVFQRAFSIQNEIPEGGYAKAFKKFEGLNEEPKAASETFASLLRNSAFIDVSLFTFLSYFVLIRL